jgi:murein L,D-transpeptidase YafK
MNNRIKRLSPELFDELKRLRWDLSYKKQEVVSPKKTDEVAAKIIREFRPLIREDKNKDELEIIKRNNKRFIDL